MKSLSGFWAGRYSYADPDWPEVEFDCELIQSGPSVTGHITEIDIFKQPATFLMESVIDGQIHKRDFCFTKTYVTRSEYYNQPVEYVGKVHLTGNRISGRWHIGEVSGNFSLTRDKVSAGRAKTRVAATDSLFTPKW
jgi:hypothetical protein